MSSLLEVKNLEVNFKTDEGLVRAVRGVDFTIPQNKVVGVVGESGCGKSVTVRAILNILAKNARISSGEILYDWNGQVVDLLKLDPDGKRFRQIRGKEISMIFQEPMTSFSPVHTIGDQIMETLLLHENMTKNEARERAIEMLAKVGITEPANRIDEYAYELSGGMRQRAMIAMALSCNPKLLLADEPTTALDVTIQAQILELMKDMQQDFGMSVLIITHDMGVIAEIADYVTVMYLGKVVESATVRDIFYNPIHPYTRALLKSIPKIEKTKVDKLPTIAGTVPDAYNIPAGCAFSTRCTEFIKGKCNQVIPDLVEVEKDHKVACLRYTDGVTVNG